MGLFEKVAKQLWRIGKIGIESIPRSNLQVSTNVPASKMRSPVQLGKLFDRARHRLDAQKQIGKQTGKQFFTSDLSTNEYFLAREAGCEPIGMVMGSSFYKVGFYGYFRGYRDRTGEVDALTQAQLTVRELALSRMQQEAALLGAHGIIGVRLQQRRKGWNVGMVEFTAIGTAIRIPGRPPTSKPFTSDLSGQEFWQLRKAGYYPKGLVFGACSYYVHSDRNTRNLMNRSLWNRLFGKGRQNQELIQLTQGLQDARELAIMRLTEDISQLGATGAVGMHIEKSEETIVYQPWTVGGCFNLLLAWLFILSFGGIFFGIATGNPAASDAILSFFSRLLSSQIGVILFITSPVAILLSSTILSILGFSSGPFTDLLINFVAIGTAIVEDEMPIANPVSKTLMFYPLSKS